MGKILLGVFIGLAAGTVHFLVLSRFVSAVGSGKINIKIALLGMLQFFIPFAVLTLCAFIIRSQLLWVGCGMVAALICGAVIKLLNSRRAKDGESRDD